VGLSERSYQAGHHVKGRAGGLRGHPIREEPKVGPEARPPKGPHSATDPDDVVQLEDDIEDIEESLTFLEIVIEHTLNGAYKKR